MKKMFLWYLGRRLRMYAPYVIGAVVIVFMVWWIMDYYSFTEYSLYVLGALSALFSVWVLLSLVSLKPGKYSLIENLGGGFVEVIAGPTVGTFVNHPKSINYDPRYPDWEFIPTMETVVNDPDDHSVGDGPKKVIRAYRWGKPGYNSPLNEEAKLESDHQIFEFDRTFVDDRSLFNKKTSYHFPGLWPFYRVKMQKIVTRKIVSTVEIAGKIQDVQGDKDEHPDFEHRWVSHDRASSMIEKLDVCTHRDIVSDQVVVITEAETGYKHSSPHGHQDDATTNHNDEHHSEEHENHDEETHDIEAEEKEDAKHTDELMQVDVPIMVQTRIVNPYRLLTKNVQVQSALDNTLGELMRDFISANTFDSLQSAQHSRPKSKFKLTMLSANGEYVEDAGKFTLLPGLKERYAIAVTDGCHLSKITPANEASAKMVRARQQIYVSQQGIIVAQNEGKAAGLKYSEEKDRQTKSDKKYRDEVYSAPVNPEVNAIATGIGNVTGTVVFDKDTISSIVNLNPQSSGNKKPSENKEEKKEDKKSHHDKKEEGGKHDDATDSGTVHH